MARTGRPSARTPANEAKILIALTDGATMRESARRAGIGYTTLMEWQAEVTDFADHVKDAVEKHKNDLLELVHAAARPTAKGPGQWQAAAWSLERRWPSEFARTERVEVSFDVRKEAERLAAELGMSVDEVLAEAEAVLAGRA